MKIDRIELFHVEMPLIYPWRTAYGEDTAIQTVLCRMSSGSIDGWGESTPLAAPCYSAEWAGGAFAVARDWLAPRLLGQRIESGDRLQQRLATFKGNPFAKAVLDNAWWALHCKTQGKSLHSALGATRSRAAVGADFGVMDSIDELLTAIGDAVSEGFARVKLKFRPGWDTDMVAQVRKTFPNTVFHIDCNSGYRLEDSEIFRELDAFELAMIEQPLGDDDLVDHAELQRMVNTPICLDESVKAPHHAVRAIQLGSCQLVNIKPGRVGGLTNALKIHDICRDAGIPCWVGGMLESAVGASHCAALAMLDNFTYPGDIFPSSRFYEQDLSEPALELEKDEAGSPCVVTDGSLPEPVPDRLRRLTLQRAVAG